MATLIAAGDLNQVIHYKSGDELGVLADDFNQVTVRLREYIKYINEIADTLREIAKGNLAFVLQNEYTGEFAKIRSSLEEISVGLNGVMGQLSVSSRDVAAGAEQLARDAKKASTISKEVRQGLLESNTKMQNMTEVIQKISDRSNEINKIVKTIDDIAFQTNILALNAAVEAARAGEAGKGFAVVAEEVRTLASRSAATAKETTDLLGETISSMEDEVIAANDTAKSILSAVGLADEMDSLIGGIAGHTKQQADTAAEISHGIEQIAIVVENNVNTAESSAAASEELTSQAAALRELVSRFRLKGQRNFL